MASMGRGKGHGCPLAMLVPQTRLMVGNVKFEVSESSVNSVMIAPFWQREGVGLPRSWRDTAPAVSENCGEGSGDARQR